MKAIDKSPSRSDSLMIQLGKRKCNKTLFMRDSSGQCFEKGKIYTQVSLNEYMFELIDEQRQCHVIPHKNGWAKYFSEPHMTKQQKKWELKRISNLRYVVSYHLGK
jgi:hypothetical protein